MTATTEPETLGELIADCADIPRDLRDAHADLPKPRTARPWQVDDSCHAQVADLEAYV